MGIAETFLIGICLNSTCLERLPANYTNFKITHVKESSMQKKLYYKYLEHELKGAHLKIATVQNGDLSYAVKVNGTWVGKGVAFDLLALLQDKYNFKYSVVLPTENELLGSKKKGIVGMLYHGKADLAAAFLPITSTYWQYVKFATSLDMGEWVVVMKRPRVSANGSGLLAPFSVNVWLLILLSLVCVGPIMYLIVSIQFKTCKEQRKISLIDCLWFVYGALLKQGTTLTPLSDPTRLVFATWWIFITILTAFYTANLTAFLTLSEFTLPIKNPKDIASERYPWVSISGSIIHEVYGKPTEELYAVLKNSKRKFVPDNGSEILQNWVTKRNYIYIAEKPNVDDLLYQDYLRKTKEGLREGNRCTYVMTPWSIYKRSRTFAYSKTFKFFELFDKTLRDLVEAGHIKYYLTRKIPTSKICPLNLGSKERRLRNTDLLLTYYIVGVGFIVAFIIFSIEVTMRYLKRNKKKSAAKITKSKKTGKKGKVRKTAKGQSLERGLNFGNHVPPPPRPPPAYDSLFPNPYVGTSDGKKQCINGRDYWVLKSEEGHPVLVPVRTPSALLFQYTN